MNNTNLLSIGQSLKEIRESKKITLKKVAEQTRISVSNLQAIEEGQVSAFPVHAYLRGFILAYVKALNLDEQEWEKELKSLSPNEENVHLSEVAGHSGSAETIIEKENRLTPVILATLILFILGSILVLSNILSSYKEKDQNLSLNTPLIEQEKDLNNSLAKNSNKSSDEKDQTAPDVKIDPKQAKSDNLKPNISPSLEEEATEPNPSLSQNDEENISPSSNQSKAEPPAEQNTQEIEIIVKALEEVRVHYQVDQGKKQSTVLTEDQFKVLKGKENIFIKTKHSDLVYIFYNGEDLGLFGSGGTKEQSFSLTKTLKRKDTQ